MEVRTPPSLRVAVAVALLLTACGGGQAGLEPVPDKSGVVAASSSSDDQGEAAFRDESLGIDLVVQVEDKETKKRVSGVDVLIMAGGEDVVFAAVDPAGTYLPALTSKTRAELAMRSQEQYAAAAPVVAHSGAQATPVVLLLTKMGRVGWQELQAGLEVSDLVQRFGIFQTEHCLTPAELETSGGFPGKLVVVALPPPGVLEGAPLTSFGVLVDQLAEFLTLSGIPDQPFLARGYRLPKIPLWILEVDGPCIPKGGGPASPPVSPFVSPPGESPPVTSPPCLPGASPPCSPPEATPTARPPSPPSPPLPTPTAGPPSPPGPVSPPPAPTPTLGPVSPPLPTATAGPISPPPAPTPTSGPVSPPRPPTPTLGPISPPGPTPTRGLTAAAYADAEAPCLASLTAHWRQSLTRSRLASPHTA